MKSLIVTFGAAALAAGSAFAATADEQNFAERFAQMQVQSGAAFPNAPLYKRAPTVAAETAVPARKAMAAEQERSDFADRFAEMQRQSGAKFVTAPLYERPGATALAEKQSDKPIRR